MGKRNEKPLVKPRGGGGGGGAKDRSYSAGTISMERGKYVGR